MYRSLVYYNFLVRMKRAERKKQTSHHRMYVKCRERSAYASSA